MSQQSNTRRLSAFSLGLIIAITTLTACSTDSRQTHSTATQPAPELGAIAKSDEDFAQAPQELEQIVVTGSPVNADSAMPSESKSRPQVDQLLSQRAITQSRIAKFRHEGAANAIVAMAPPPVPEDRENYAPIETNPVQLVADNPVSTFSVDVDTGAYANVRRFLNNDQLPPHDAVRVEELINYFTYDYPTPSSVDQPFSVTTEVAQTPWNADSLLVHIGLKGYEIEQSERPATNLVFLLDVSGSMQNPDKLPLLKKSFRLLTKQLTAQDSVAIVVYAGASGVVLEPTPGNERRTIMSAIRKLRAGGSTNGAAGINLAYELAEEAFIEDGINRIVLATDGDFNVGTTNFERLIDLAEHKRKSGIALTTLGFGSGNYNDKLMEQLADAGNGNYAYIDSLSEARKVLVNELSSTLMTIAKDVKLQIEFNPALVAEYRLIGYENRTLRREDFTNDKVDAGEIGAGHTVTALYEIVPTSSSKRWTQALRYENKASDRRSMSDPRNQELAYLKLRFKQPDGDTSREISYPIKSPGSDEASSDNLRFSAAVAAFGQLLGGGNMIGDFTFDDIESLAKTSTSNDRHGYRREFVELVNHAADLSSDLRSDPTNNLAISD